MPIANLPPGRRPRERLARLGAPSLSTSELVSVLLGSGSSGRSVDALSRAVEQSIAENGFSYDSLHAVPGIGPAKAAVLCAAVELSVRTNQMDPRTTFMNAEEVYASCSDLLRLPQENVVAFYLDVRNRSLARETISIGTVSASIVHPRDVFRAAIIGNASSLILAHNHPSGDPTPSSADLTVTRRVVRAGETMGIKLLDHVVCGTRGFVSLKERHPELFS
jgi:DNA repair protein RadC